MESIKKSTLPSRVITGIRPYSIFIIVISFIAMLATGYYIVSIDRTPIYIEKTVTQAKYDHVGTFNYLVLLKENTIFDNQRQLTTNEGPLYRNIINNLTLYYDYDLRSGLSRISHQEDIMIDVYIESPENFIKKLTEEEKQLMFDWYKGRQIIIDVKFNKIADYYQNLTSDTQVSSAGYIVKIVNKVDVNTIFYQKRISEQFIHELVLDLTPPAEKGTVISLEGLRKTETKEILGTIKEKVPVNLELKTYLTAAYLTTWPIFASSLLIHQKVPHQRKKKSEIEKLIDKNSEILIESQSPAIKGEQVTNVSTLDELVKLSEYTMKPVFYHRQEDECVFYLVDQNTVYQFTYMENS